MSASARAAALSAALLASCGDPPAAGPPSAASQGVSLVDHHEPDDPGLAPAGLPREKVPERSFAQLGLRPESTTPARCDLEGTFCVHGATDDESAALLEAARDARDALLALGLPAPRHDADGRVDIHVEPARDRAETFVDPGSAVVGYDLGTAFIVSPPLRPGCRERQSLASAVGKAILFGKDAALNPGVAEMIGGYLGVLASPCSVAEIEAIDTAQRAPERCFLGEPGGTDPASFLFPWFLEDRYGTGEPGKLAVALVAISGQKTPGGAPLVDEPDVFDALRVTQQKNGASLAETLLEFGVYRAFLGTRSDEGHMVDVAKYGDLGRPRIEWDVPYASLPRTLKPLRPIEPLGATYLHIDLASAAPESELTFVIDWERPVGFRWAVVRLDASGNEIGRKEYAPILGATHLEATLRDFGEAKALLIVGVNEGESRRDEPFDPGTLREPAKSYVITLAK